MNPIERYDGIINTIENSIEEDPYERIQEIIDKLLSIGITTRDLGVVIKFFTGMSLVEYIRKRKMNYSYKCMKKMPQFDLNKVIEFTEYSDQSAYSKAFKKEYGITPKKAYESNKIFSKEPLIMENIKSGLQIIIEEPYEEEKKLFGVEKSLYNRIIMAQDYKEIYGLNDVQANVAFKYSEKNNVSLEDAFEFVYGEMAECKEFIGKDIYDLDEDSLEKIIISCDRVMNMFAETELDMPHIRMIYERCEFFGVNFFELDNEFIWNYMNTYIPVDDFIEAYKFYLDNKDKFSNSDEIEHYFVAMDMFGDYECAFSYIHECIDPQKMMDDADDELQEENAVDIYFDSKEDDDYDRDFYGDKLTVDYDRYDPEDPFDDRYDPDNPEYGYDDQYDPEEFDDEIHNFYNPESYIDD